MPGSHSPCAQFCHWLADVGLWQQGTCARLVQIPGSAGWKPDISFQLRPFLDPITHAPEYVWGYVKVEGSEEVFTPSILFDFCPRFCGQVEYRFKFAGNPHLALTTAGLKSE